MQTGVITQVIKFAFKFKKFDDWVYVKIKFDDPFLLSRKFFDEKEKRYANQPGAYEWLLDIEKMQKHFALSTDYLKRYFEEGIWAPDNHSAWIVDPLPLLEAGIKDRYYTTNVYQSGFIFVNGHPVRRAFSIRLYEYHPKDIVVEKLQKNPKVLNVAIEESVWDNEKYIRIVYMPSVKEFNRLATNLGSANFDIEQRLGIERFKG